MQPGDDKRTTILAYLIAARRGLDWKGCRIRRPIKELGVCELANALGWHRHTVRKHLRKLDVIGFFVRMKEFLWSRYRKSIPSHRFKVPAWALNGRVRRPVDLLLLGKIAKLKHHAGRFLPRVSHLARDLCIASRTARRALSRAISEAWAKCVRLGRRLRLSLLTQSAAHVRSGIQKRGRRRRERDPPMTGFVAELVKGLVRDHVVTHSPELRSGWRGF